MQPRNSELKKDKLNDVTHYSPIEIEQIIEKELYALVWNMPW